MFIVNFGVWWLRWAVCCTTLGVSIFQGFPFGLVGPVNLLSGKEEGGLSRALGLL